MLYNQLKFFFFLIVYLLNYLLLYKKLFFTITNGDKPNKHLNPYYYGKERSY